MIADTSPDVIARLSIGLDVCVDDVGSICVADRRNGFAVFVNGGNLPGGERERFFPASDTACLRNAFDFALSVAAIAINQEVQDEKFQIPDAAGNRSASPISLLGGPISLLGEGDIALLAERIVSELLSSHLDGQFSDTHPSAYRALRSQHCELTEKVRETLREVAAWCAPLHDEELS